LEFLLDDKAKRRLSNKGKTNSELFTLYYDHLRVRLTQGQVTQYRALLDKFHQFLGEFPPSVELATKFLAGYANLARNTMVRYAGIMRGFMDWYGETLNIRPVKSKSLPQYVAPKDIGKLIGSIRSKSTHKGTVERDIMLIKFAINTGLRRGELARLTVSDIQLEERVVFVRHGKGDKDRTIPLLSKFVGEFSEYVKDMRPTDSVFNLTDRSITDKIYTWSKKAGLKIHAHSLRHYFAEQLLEKRVPLTVVSALLGHEDLQTTASYLGLRPGSLREAVEKLGEPLDKENTLVESKGEFDHAISDSESSNVDVEEGGLPNKLKAGQEPYIETHHKQKMRELAGDLRREVGLPPDLEVFLKLKFSAVALSIDREENHLNQGLRSHLKSGGFSEVLEQIQDWKTYANKYLTKCHDLFENIKSKIPDNEPIADPDREPNPGLILDPFCGTGGAEIVGRVTGFTTHLVYTTVRHYLDPDLWVLKYGAYGIYLAPSREELEKHQKMHEDLIVEYASDPVTADYTTLKKNLSEIDIQISRQLQKFIDLERVPGYCELCSTGGMVLE